MEIDHGSPMKAKRNESESQIVRSQNNDLAAYVPLELTRIANPQTAIPAIAKDVTLTSKIQDAVRLVPTTHQLFLRDAREMEFIDSETVHLVLTSPPYWTLKKYRDSPGQL